jgi:hypothetical protein
LGDDFMKIIYNIYICIYIYDYKNILWSRPQL